MTHFSQLLLRLKAIASSKTLIKYYSTLKIKRFTERKEFWLSTMMLQRTSERVIKLTRDIS